jgi:hypothetical protein
MLSYQETVNGLRAVGVPLEKAEREARRQCADAPDPAPVESARDAAVDEKAEQRAVWGRFTVCGFHGYWLSQARASKQTPGLPDLWFVHRIKPVALWWETKRQVGGEHSDAQIEFAAECSRAGVGYGTGDRYHAEQWLVAHGFAQLVNGVLEPIPHDGLPF